MERPNIVLIVSDDHGREALGCYGNSAVNTPNLDALAEDGVRFTDAFCTTASCSPSRSVILTGLHNHTNGTYGLTHAIHHFSCFETVDTLPGLIKGAGYRTGRVGKTHYVPERLFPFDWGAPPAQFGRDDVAMAEYCRPFVAEREPFFLYWCSHNPHRGGKIADHPLGANSFGNPARPFAGDTEQPYAPEDVEVPAFLPDIPEVRAELAQYYQSVSRLDRGVGRLVQILKDEGQYDNTVIIYISDNGAAFPEAKTTLYDPGMRLPCLVRSPMHDNRGSTCDGLITWADITPTVLDFAGVEYDPERFFGRSFKGILHETTPTDWRDEIYASHSLHQITNYYPMRVVRTHRYKFIWNIAWKLDYPFASDLWNSGSWQGARRRGLDRFGVRCIDDYIRRPRFELYDLACDPHETNNLAGDERYRGLVGSFTDKIKQFQEETNDPWAHKWTYE
jgi:N-sulfoglucosamine sulfohydrolase